MELTRELPRLTSLQSWVVPVNDLNLRLPVHWYTTIWTRSNVSDFFVGLMGDLIRTWVSSSFIRAQSCFKFELSLVFFTDMSQFAKAKAMVSGLGLGSSSATGSYGFASSPPTELGLGGVATRAGIWLGTMATGSCAGNLFITFAPLIVQL